MTTQDKIIWYRKMIKSSKETLMIQKNSLNNWKRVRNNSTVFMELREHMIKTFEKSIQSSMEGLKEYNDSIQDIIKNELQTKTL